MATNATRRYKNALIATSIASIASLGTAGAMIANLPKLAALDPETSAAVLAILMPAMLVTFAMPLIHHARAVHIAAQAGLQIGRTRKGIRAFRMYRHAIIGARRQRRGQLTVA